MIFWHTTTITEDGQQRIFGARTKAWLLNKAIQARFRIIYRWATQFAREITALFVRLLREEIRSNNCATIQRDLLEGVS